MTNPEENIVLTEAVFYTLLALHKPLHGYGIMQETKAMSNGRLILSAGTLYGAISSMLEKGWIKALPEEEDSPTERIRNYGHRQTGGSVRIKQVMNTENGDRIINN